tara:strand:- start:291 stop:524 length:234 start_codon:yes stop_codon:yes gene_type:complete
MVSIIDANGKELETTRELFTCFKMLCSERIVALEFTVKELRKNLSVIEEELSKIAETECGLNVWDRVSLALEFAERD